MNPENILQNGYHVVVQRFLSTISLSKKENKTKNKSRDRNFGVGTSQLISFEHFVQPNYLTKNRIKL